MKPPPSFLCRFLRWLMPARHAAIHAGTKLVLEQFEDRTLMNAAPTIGSVVFDTHAPTTNTVVQAQTWRTQPANFQNHLIVLIDGVLYDPSYGVTYVYAANNPLAGFAQTVLGGMMVHFPFDEQRYNFDLDGDGQLTAYYAAFFKTPNLAELTMV